MDGQLKIQNDSGDVKIFFSTMENASLISAAEGKNNNI